MLRLTHDAIQDIQLSATDQWVINGQKDASNLVLEQLEGFIYGLRAQQLGFDGVAAVERKILDQVGQLSSLLEVLHGYDSFSGCSPFRVWRDCVLDPKCAVLAWDILAQSSSSS